MIGKRLENLANELMENERNPNIDKEIIVYGLSSAIEHGVNIITTVVLGLLFGLTLESIVFLMTFSLIRTYAGGYHCQKAINCYLMSSGVILLVLGLVKVIPKEYMIIIGAIMLFVAIPILLKFAPIGTPNKPLDEDERKHYRKKTIIHLIFECVLIITLFFLQLHSFAFVACLGIIVSAGLVFFQLIILCIIGYKC